MDRPWKVVLAFLGVFIAGAVFGGLFALRIDRTISQRRLQEQAALAAKAPAQPAPAQPRPPGTTQPSPASVQTAQLMRRVTNQLNLSRPQRERINPFLQRAVQDFWRQQQNFQRENAFLLQRLKQDIARELTPQQQVRLDDLWLKALEHFRKQQAEAQAQAGGQQPSTPATPLPGEAKPSGPPPPESKPAGGPSPKQ